MYKSIQLLDKTFRLYIEAAEIDRAVSRLAREINRDMEGARPLFLVVLNGAFMFASDLLKEVTVEGTTVIFTRLASYAGTASTGEIKELIGLTGEVAGRNVVIVEDIVDTGRSIAHLLEMLKARGARQVKVAALFYKPDALEREVTIDYAGIALKNDFVVGRGLDYDDLGRNLPDLYTLAP
ncbi:MAG: hypoxanthine phosphoribosyltransferase [Odoribacteraceae bacterium]|jgi:hypoxanthine phosphoribosyltransferase|nr:hypoxanthine phosphoribosyltransferase [Odoribacteraceae bacterium]